MKALIDADILIYRIGFTTETEDLGVAQWRMDDLIKTILSDVKADTYQMYLTASNDKTAFRKIIYPDYKGNRKAPRPKHYVALREYLVAAYGASMSETIEADDAIGIDSQCTPDCVVVSIDKDLLQLPGLHYNFVKKEFTTVTPHEGLRFFYKQCLMGDKADNIKGVGGIGVVKAEKILANAEDYGEGEEFEQLWFAAVRETFDDDLNFWKDGNCLWILQQPYPQGTWSCHPLGSTLTPEMDEEQ